MSFRPITHEIPRQNTQQITLKNSPCKITLLNLPCQETSTTERKSLTTSKTMQVTNVYDEGDDVEPIAAYLHLMSVSKL